MATFPDLISFSACKDQCRILHNDDDVRIERFRFQAQKIILDYLKVAETAYDYYPNSSPVIGAPLPFHIEAAMLLVVQELYDNNRHITTNEPIDPITVSVRSVLERSRDPTLA